MVLGDYEVLDTVGTGSFAKVSRVRRRSSSEIFVWKELSYGVMSDKGKQMLCDEVNILRDLNHPNIVQFVDRIIDHQNRKIYIVQEYCNGGDLASYIKLKKEKVPKMSGRISETFVWSVTAEISSALQHCHNHFKKRGHGLNTKRRILHRDLKPGNVFLVKRRGTYSVKLGDFGLAKSLDASSTFAQTHVGTPYYMSPEQIQNTSYNEKSDIWSLGCIVYEMAMLSPPFKASNYLHLAEKIKLGQYKKVQTRNYSDELDSAIGMMLTVDSRKRAAVEDLLCLPRIQFTSKMLRLDRRYSQLKKKEQQFHQKMQEFETKIKKRSLALLKKETALKLKESELQQKEKEALLFSSNTSTHSNQSRSSQTSPTHGHMGSQLSDDKSAPSERSSKANSVVSPPHNIVSPSFTLGRATSIASTHNTSRTSTMESSNGCACHDEMGEGGDCTCGTIDERKEESPQKGHPAELWPDITMHSTAKSIRHCPQDSSQILLNDARNFLMKRVNLSDLANDLSASGSEDKTNEAPEERDGDPGGSVSFADFLVDGIDVSNLQIDENSTEWKQPEEVDVDNCLKKGDELRRRRHVLDSNDTNHPFSFPMSSLSSTPRESYGRTLHRDLKSVRMKSCF